MRIKTVVSPQKRSVQQRGKDRIGYQRIIEACKQSPGNDFITSQPRLAREGRLNDLVNLRSLLILFRQPELTRD